MLRERRDDGEASAFRPRRHYVIKDAVSKWSGKIEGRSVNQGTVVRRGPLVFAYPIPEMRSEDVAEHANMRGKKSANPDFKCWNLRPAGPFNYALAAHRAQVISDDSGVSIQVPVRRIEWSLEDDRFTPDLPERPVVLDGKEETIELVPYGKTMLRLAVFPDLTTSFAGAACDPLVHAGPDKNLSEAETRL